MLRPWSCWAKATSSSARPEVGAAGAGLALAALLALAACMPKSGQSLPDSRLDNLVGNAIGDPATCLLLANARTGAVVYRYGDEFNCVRPLPACDSPGVMNAKAGLAFATRPGGRMQSCPSVPDGSRWVGWAEGRAPGKTRDLIYSAVMEGEHALPGHEMNARLYDAFTKAGL
jgi:hypothetical protein